MLLCENTREQAEEHLESWRMAIENKGQRHCESAGARQNVYHRLPVMAVKLILVEKKSRM